MKDVAGSGRTVLFVSHNMTALNSLCSRGLYLKEGKIESMGDIDAIVNEYLLKENAAVLEKSWAGAERPGDNIARLEHVRLIGRNGEKPHSILMNEAIGLEFTYEITEEGYFPTPNIHLFTSRQEHVLASHDKPRSGYHKKGRYRSVVWIPPDLLNEGTYIAGIALTTMNPARIHFYEPEAIIFEVLENTLIRDIEYNKRLPGVVRPKLDWSTEPV
jgi:lipopolysaccharide transport system ATP-binding protein